MSKIEIILIALVVIGPLLHHLLMIGNYKEELGFYELPRHIQRLFFWAIFVNPIAWIHYAFSSKGGDDVPL